MAIIAEMLTGKQAFKLELETLNYIVIGFFFLLNTILNTLNTFWTI